MTAVSLLDSRTIEAIREAMRAAGSGRIVEACRIGEQALASGGDPAALNAMLGTFHLRQGQIDAAIRHLSVAREARRDDPVIASNLASALAKRGDYAEALEAVPEGLAERDQTMGLTRLRGFLAQMSEDFATAITAYERVVAAIPADWETWNNLGNARRLAGDFEGSVEASRRAATLEPRSAPVRLNLASALIAAGKFEEGEEQLRKMAGDFPQDAKPLRELHALLKEQGRDEESLEAIEKAIEREPDDIELLLGAASHRLTMMKTEAAEDACRKVIALDPAHPLGNLSLAIVFELTNRTQELAEFVPEAERRGVGDDSLNFIRALDHRRAKRFAEGLEALAKVPDELETARRCLLLGQLEEGARNYGAAFAAYTRMNEIMLDDPSQPEARGAAYRQLLRGSLDTVTAQWMEGWRDLPPADDRPSPAFLVGFPRSGTTLLDTMLMGHPQVEVLEEEPPLRKATTLLPPLAELPAATPDQVAEARDEYFRIAAELTPLAPGNLLIDKNPLSMNSIPFIARMFPDARIILATRHPCDVVLSCFVSNFKLNDAMTNFLKLDTAADLYDLSFSYFEQANRLLKLPVHRVTYEKVVADAPGELGPLLDFLGLEWSDQVLDHESTAINRGRIKTPSYSQVVEPIYKRSAGRWENFRKHLEPVLPVLGPWAARFGYTL